MASDRLLWFGSLVQACFFSPKLLFTHCFRLNLNWKFDMEPQRFSHAQWERQWGYFLELVASAPTRRRSGERNKPRKMCRSNEKTPCDFLSHWPWVCLRWFVYFLDKPWLSISFVLVVNEQEQPPDLVQPLNSMWRIRGRGDSQFHRKKHIFNGSLIQ